MGVQGLWQLLQPTGRPITLESLDGKVLGIDVSIWLNQAVKGMRDQQGGTLDNAHLLSLFHRICKLLFYRVKPVFVFDGGVPLLKRQTLSLRRQRKEEAENSSEKATRKLVNNQLKQHALNAVLGVATSNMIPAPSRQPDLFELPPLPEAQGEQPQPDELSFDEFSVYDELQYLSDVDLESSDFLSLPAEIQHELLTELKESRRSTCWAKLDSLPQASVDFSNYQIAKLRKQNQLTQKIEKIRRDMNAKTSGNIAVSLSEDLSAAQIESHKVMSEDSAHYILVKGLSKVSNPGQTFDDTSGARYVMPLSDRLAAVAQDIHPSYVNPDDVTQSEGHSVDVDDASFGVTRGQVLEVEDMTSDDGDVKFDSNDIRLTENEGNVKSDTNDVRLNDNEVGCRLINIDNNEIATDDRLNKGNDKLAQCNDLSDVVSPKTRECENNDTTSMVDIRTEESTQGHTVIKVNDMSALQTVTMSPSAVDGVIEPSSLQNTVTEDSADQDGQKEREHKMDRHTDRKMEVMDEEDTESDEDFIEVASEDTEVIVQSVTLTSSTGSCHSDVDSRGHSSNDQCLPLSSGQQDCPVANSDNVFEGLSLPELEDIQGALEADTAQLEQERGQQQRAAATVTGQMYTEAQELLQLFGLPYITSPMEAEAQCAYLDMTDQTEGSITDDSDIWLFGGQRVYKNFFNQNRDIEFYKMADISAHLMLDRSQCISVGLLCGSDYTEGIPGVGPVTAMEILAEFPGVGIERLQRFSDWWQQREKKVSQETKVKGQLRKLQLQPGFPSRVVREAYLKPAVDESRETFEWSLPELDQLREFTKTRFGWTRQKVDESLLPIMKRLSDSQCQRSITTYFPTQLTQTKRVKSKRVKAVLNRMRTSGVTTQYSEDNCKNVSTTTVKAKRQKKNSGKVLKIQGMAVASGGFLSGKKTEVATEVLLSESSSGSDCDSRTCGTTTSTVNELSSQTEWISQITVPSARREKNTRKQQKKKSN